MTRDVTDDLSAGRVLTLRIDDLTSDGDGVGRVGGRVVFVRGGLPGDRLVVRVTRLRRRVVEAVAETILEPSADRVTPICRHQERCGGCPLMPLRDDRALDFKASHLEQVLRRIGGIEAPIGRCVPSPRGLEYRSRVRFRVGRRARRLSFGYAPRGGGSGLVPIERCHLIDREASRLAGAVLERLDGQLSLRAAWPREMTLRWLRGSLAWLITLRVGSGDRGGYEDVAESLRASEPSILGLGIAARGRLRALSGQLCGIERLCGLEFNVAASSFTQVNPEATELLVREVGSGLGPLGPGARVLDLYCGIGVLGLATTATDVEIVGVESDSAAVESAIEAARRQGRRGADYRAGDALAVAEDLLRNDARFDAAILNPPRSGCGPGAAATLRALGVRRVAMVSCHPAALARDLAGFVGCGYRLSRLTAVDMFPQTPHLEAVALLDLPRGADDGGNRN